MDENKPLFTKPIRELKIDLFDMQYVLKVQYYLERTLGCAMTYVGDGYLVRFPEGKVEETYMGRETQWTRETTIRLPNGVTLTKFSRSALNTSQKPRVDLAYPNAILDVPLAEPEGRD